MLFECVLETFLECCVIDVFQSDSLTILTCFLVLQTMSTLLSHAFHFSYLDRISKPNVATPFVLCSVDCGYVGCSALLNQSVHSIQKP